MIDEVDQNPYNSASREEVVILVPARLTMNDTIIRGWPAMTPIHSITLAVTYKNIPDIPGIGTPIGYQCGSEGSIWSSFAARGTRVDGGTRYKQLKGCLRKDGYRSVTLTISGNVYHFLVHRLILLTFVGPCPEGMESCHRNGIKHDNRLENLRYDTHIGNTKDKFEHGTVLRGEQIAQSKLNEKDVLKVRRLSELGVPYTVIADAFEVDKTTIYKIVQGMRWTHL